MEANVENAHRLLQCKGNQTLPQNTEEAHMDPNVEEVTTEPVEVSSDPELINKVRSQIEYYFSKENLQQDAFLMSQMDSNMSVPISVIMQFAKLKTLTQNESLVISALENSTLSIVDGRIKSNVKSGGRSTIILREIPSDCPEEEVREIFTYEGCRPIASMRSDIGDTWFVTMESEEDAKDTLIDLKLKKRTFRGSAVKGRMKSETIVRSFYPMQPAPPLMYGGMMPFPPYGAPMPVDMRAYGYGVVPNGMHPSGLIPAGMGVMPGSRLVVETGNVKASLSPSGAETHESFSVDGESSGEAKSVNGVKGERKNIGANGTGLKPSPSRDGVRDRKAGGAPNGPIRERDRPHKEGGVGGERRSAGGAGNGGNSTGGRGKPREGVKPSSVPAIEITAANFPPLPAQESETPIPTPGFKGEFKKYTYDEIINIVKDIKDAVLPASITPERHLLAMTTEANLDLLKRQRSFSIDETREQLRQGRPVQREAISSGAVDSGSLWLGDGNHGDVATASHEGAASSSIRSSGEKEGSDKKGTADGSDVSNGSSVVASTPASKKVPSASSWAAMVMSSTPTLEGIVGANSPKLGSPRVEKTPSSTKVKAGSASATAAKIDSATAGKKSGTPPAAAEKGPDRRVVGERGAKRADGKMGSLGAGSSANRDGPWVRNGKVEDSVDVANGAVRTEAEGEGEASEKDKGKDKPASITVQSGWGGKATFASILKQAPEPPIALLTPTAASAASADVSVSKPAKSASSPSSPHRRDGSRRNHSSKASTPVDAPTPVFEEEATTTKTNGIAH